MTRIFIGRLVFGLASSLVLAPALLGAQALRTVAERSNFTQYTPYDSMMTYLDAVRETSTEMRLGTYGETWNGRALPYAVFSRPSITQPWEAWSLGKPIIVLAAGVHGGERTLRESVLIMTRELATKGTPANALLDDLVIIMVPQINPDGFSAEPRPTRGNAWGIDLNRDYIKLEQPEIAGYVENVILRWAPHLFVDGHNGGSFPYNINYQCTSHAAADQRITELCDRELFPAIDAALAKSSYKSWYYQSGTATRWNGGGSEARIGRNYGGFANTIGVLFESPSQEMSDGVKSGVIAYMTVAEFVRANAEKVMSVVQTARRETIEMGDAPRGEIVVQQRYGPEPRKVTYEIGVGRGEDRRIQRVTSDSLMKQPIPTKTRPRPYAYILPRDARDAVALLRRHDIAVEELQDSITVEVDAYVLTGVSYEQAYNHAAATRVTVADTVVRQRRTFPAGSFVIRTGQMQGRVAAHMLEPESTDNIIYWNLMDAWLPKAALARTSTQAAPDEEDDAPRGPQRAQGPPLIPIYKVMRPVAFPGRLVP